jgi:cysteine-rich repeat protein
MPCIRRDSLLIVAALATACGPGLLGETFGQGDDVGTEPGATEGSATRSDDDEGEAEGFPPGEDGEVGEVDGNNDDDDDDDEAGDEVDSGVMSVCGDGFVDEGEQCDDGNDVHGDGCDPDCTPTSGLMLWSQTFDGAGEDDIARDVAIQQGGDIVVVGAMEIDNGDDVWAHVFTPDGGTIADTRLDLGSDERGTSVAVTSVGGTYVVGTQPQDDRALLMLLDGSDLVELGGAPTEITSFTALASTTGEGFAIVTNAGGFDSPTATLRRFDYAAEVLGDVPQQPGIFVGAAIPSGDGGTILGGGGFSARDMESSVWVAAVGVDGSPGWSSSAAGDAGANVRLRSIAMAGDGRIVGVGSRGFGGMDEDDQGWIWWWSAAGMPEADGPLDIGGAAARPNAVVVGANGLIVGGTTLAFDDGFVAGLTFEGALQWGYELVGDLGLEDGVLALELNPGYGVVAVGWVTQSSTGEDAWVGMFTE